MSSTDVNVAVPEVLYLRTIADGQVTEGALLYSVAAVWSNSPGNITIQVISDDFTTDPSPIIVPAPGLVTPTIVSITSLEDVVAQGDRIVTVKIQVSSSTGTTTEASFPVTITDDDTAGVSVTESSGNTAVSEGGATDNYSVVLTSQPTANVTVNLNGGAQLNLSATALTFTPQNWNVAQVVTVTAVNDAVVEGNHTQTISHTAISTDARYNGISIRSVNANITDNDKNDPPSFTAGPNQTVAEDSGPGFFPHWATNISPGPADEASQIINFQVTNNNNELFSVQPAIDSAGNLTYTPAANANGSATVTVSLQDDGGTANGGVDTSAPQTFTITITPVNDTATISGIATSAITEDLNVVNGNLSASGNLSVSDADTSEAKFNTTVTSAAANLGSLNITETGDFTYTVANSAVQYLGKGETKTETFSVQSVDGTASQDITITINGVNDIATITGTPTAAVTEDTSTPNLTAIGSLTVADADTSEAKFNTTVTSAAANKGSLSITETGNFTYTVANTAVQYLGKGETKAETFTVKSVDGTASQDITITINGVNDIAIITGTTTTTVTEDASTPNLTATGTLIVADADTGEAKFNTTVTSAAANKGSLSITETGDFTYTVTNSAVQYLGKGETKTETFSVQSVDGTASQDITITINGVNDIATITGTPTAAVTEDTSTPNLTAIGSLTVADADTSEAKFNTTVTSAAANKGSLSITETGNFTYTVANTAVQYLGKGETKAETFTVKSVDGTASQDITITINGVNDIATITGTTTTTVTEDASTPNLTATGTLIVADADTGEAKFNTTVISAAANKGSLSITETGDFTYTVTNSAVQYLGKGVTKTETFSVQSVDGTASQDITITINGSNDTATIIGTTTAGVTEDSSTSNLTAIGSLTVADADTGEAKFNTTVTSAAANLGSLSITETGNFTYTVANSAVQYLGALQTKTETFSVQSVDGTASQDITIIINGVNDIATITGTATAAVTEDTSTPNLTAIGSLTVADADTSEAKFNTTVISADNIGSLSITETGNFTYTVANTAVQYLGALQTKTETFSVQSVDGTASQDITITINGVNDIATITGTPTAAVTEDTSTPNLTAIGSLTVADADTSEAKFNTTVISADNIGSLSITETGNFTYTVANSAVQYLGKGVTKTETFSVQSVDGTASQDITITINGSNDAPTDLILSKSDIDEESAALSTIGFFSTTDTDVSDRFTYSLVDGDGANDNDAFIVDGNQLKIKASPNFEIKQSYKIRVNTTDAGLSYQKALTISVNDLDIPTRLTTKDDDIFNITGDDTKVTLQVALSGHNSHQVNELGVFIVDDATGRINGIAPDAVGYAQAALERAQVFFSALTNIPNGFDTSNLTRLVELNSGANLRFYLVKNNSTTDGILAGINSITEVLFSNSATQKVTNLGNNQFSLAWEDGSGTNNNDFQDLVVKIQSSNQSLPLGAKLQGKPQGELIDLRGVKTPVKANFILNREAAFDNFVGFYQLTDENGGIDTNGDGNADILPGQSGYTQAAVRGRVAGIDLTVSNQATATFTGSFTDGGIFAPFMIANGRPDAILDGNSNNDPAVYFPFLGANPDKADHIRLLGDNIFSFEDLQNSGDKDFNDMIVQFKLSS